MKNQNYELRNLITLTADIRKLTRNLRNRIERLEQALVHLDGELVRKLAELLDVDELAELQLQLTNLLESLAEPEEEDEDAEPDAPQAAQ